MTRVTTEEVATTGARLSVRAGLLADRLERGAEALAALARTLTHAQWNTPIPHDGRTVGVVVHHVASVYPVEIHLAQVIADGNDVTGVTPAAIDEMNGAHAQEFGSVTKEAALSLLTTNSLAAAAAIRALSDEQLDRATRVSLYADAPLTCQFLLEDHAVRHSYHHIAKITQALGLR